MKKKLQTSKTGVKQQKKEKKKQNPKAHIEVVSSTFVVCAGAGCEVICVLRCLHGMVVVCQCVSPLWGRAGAGSSLLRAGSSPLVVAGCGVVRVGRVVVLCVVRPPAALLHFNFG